MYHTLPSRREFLAFGGLAVVVISANASLLYAHETYEILLKQSPSMIDPLRVRGTSPELKEKYQQWVNDGTIPRLKELDQGLEAIANELIKDTNYLSRKLTLVGQSKKRGKLILTYEKNRLLVDGYSYDLRFILEGKIEEGAIKITELLKYSISRSQLSKEGTYVFSREGDKTYEKWEWGIKIKPPLSTSWTVHEKNKQVVMDKIDITGIRTKLLRGLRKQKIH